MSTSIASGQKFDNKWMLGYPSGVGIPQPAMDFYFGTPDTILYYGIITNLFSHVSICNAQGLLQFYTNGISISNKNHQLMTGSTNFNQDDITINYPNFLPIDDCIIALPDPGSSDIYSLFHVAGTSINGIYKPLNLRQSIIDMSLQIGDGALTSTTTQLNATLLYRTLDATKHANGRDWWILIGEEGTDKFYSLLYTPQGVVNTVTSSNLPIHTSGINRGQSCFSPDGNIYTLASSDFNPNFATNAIYIYNFDRCSGNLSLRDSFLFGGSIDSTLAGCAISPNSRYLYINNTYNLYQYDLQAPDIAASKTHIATYDAFLDPLLTYFYRMQIGPDQKIYMGTWGSSEHLSVINQPDSAGPLCNFVQHQQQLPMLYSGTLPRYPNYRLGALSGSPCDTLSVSLAEHETSSNSLFCYYSEGSIFIELPDKNSETGLLEIRTISGQLVYQKQLPPSSTYPSLKINDFTASNGIYIAMYKNRKLYLRNKLTVQN